MPAVLDDCHMLDITLLEFSKITATGIRPSMRRCTSIGGAVVVVLLFSLPGVCAYL